MVVGLNVVGSQEHESDDEHIDARAQANLVVLGGKSVIVNLALILNEEIRADKAVCGCAFIIEISWARSGVST